LAPAASALVRVRRRRLAGRALLLAAAPWALAIAGIGLGLGAVNLAVMSADSHQFVMLGGVVAADRGAAEGTLAALQAWGVFQVVAQSLAAFTQQDYLFALAPVLGLGLVALFAILLAEAARALGARGGRLVLVVALATAALATTPMFFRHILYIHTNMGSAA